MEIPYFQVDAFARRPFAGNPAGVCLLESWPEERLMAEIASENRLSETAYLVPLDPEDAADYRLRWFTPSGDEVELCGHATLASAHVLFEELGGAGPELRFRTRSGVLTVRRDGARLSMDFPSQPPEPCEAPPALAEGLGVEPVAVAASADYLAEMPDERSVRGLDPDMGALAELDRRGVIATAPGREVDFVSRFFAPKLGVPEDPVTGSAHCALTPYWSEKLGRSTMRARQLSRRGGEVLCEDRGERVTLGGTAARYLAGTIILPEDVSAETSDTGPHGTAPETGE